MSLFCRNGKNVSAFFLTDCLHVGKSVASGALVRGCGRGGVLSAAACRVHCIITKECKFFTWNEESKECKAYSEF